MTIDSLEIKSYFKKRIENLIANKSLGMRLDKSKGDIVEKY